MTITNPTSLAGRRVLLVEDEFYLAEDLANAFANQGAEVVGPAPSVDEALDLIDASERIDGAVIDLNLKGERAYPVADALMERGVKFMFATGYDAASIPARYDAVPRLEKPVDVKRVVAALFG